MNIITKRKDSGVSLKRVKEKKKFPTKREPPSFTLSIFDECVGRQWKPDEPTCRL